MARRFLLLVALSVLGVVLTAPAVEGRTWTDKRGQTVSAKFVRVLGSNVVLLRGARTMNVPIDNLCLEDQEYIRRLQAGEEPEEESGAPAETGPWSDLPQRTWTDQQGRTIEGAFAGVAGREVRLRNKDGKTLAFEYQVFSASDRDYVRQQLQDKGMSDLIAGLEPPNNPSGPAEGVAGGGGPMFAPAPHAMMPGMPQMPSMPSMPPESSTASSGPSYSPDPAAYSPPSMPAPAPSYEPPMASYAPTPPEMPSFTPPSYTPSVPQFQQVMVYACSKCNRELPSHISVGDKCPHCGAFLAYEETASGQRVDKHGKPVSWYGAGRVGGGIGLIVAVIVLIARALGNR